MRRYALRNDQWDRIKEILPGREGHVGGTAADNRLFVEAVLFRFRAGVPWRDLPARFGDWKIVYQRFNRWAKSGVFERVFRLLASDHDNEYMMIDATIVRARRHSAGAQHSAQAIGRSRGGLTTKIHALVDALGNPVEVMLSPGQDHDLTCAQPLIEAVDPGALIADKAFDADAFIAALNDRAIVPVIPSKSNRKSRARATSPSTANAISLSVFSTSSSISGPSPRVTTSSPRFSSPPSTSPAPPSSSTEDRP